VGAGPIRPPVSRWLIKSAAAMADYRSYRDTASKALMDSIGLDVRGDEVYPDIAFKLPAPRSTRREGAENESLSIGVGVIDYSYLDRHMSPEVYEAYFSKLTEFVLWLVDHGHLVRLLTGDVIDRHAVADLARAVRAARPDLPPDRLRVDASNSLHDLMREIAETDVVVAMRFHNVVCALKLGKPTVSISYGLKNDVLMAEVGLGRFCQHISQLQLSLLIEQFTCLISGRQHYEQSLRDTNLLFQKRLAQQDSLLMTQFI
jgi:polysaccharide pyruvyl transferase WcaK-like protein